MLKILGSTWGTLVRARASLYTSGWLPRSRLARPVISVGALSVGGAGKTPTTAMLAALLREAGLRPAILSRGYRRDGNGPLLVSAGDGEGPRVSAAQAGDEPFWMARALPHVAVAVAARREQAAALALASGARDVFLLDDGYQHLRVARDADLLVVNPEAPFWDDAPMPAGRLRELPAAARRADAFLMIGAHQPTAETLEQRFAPRPHFVLLRQPPACRPLAAATPAATAVLDPGEPAGIPSEPAYAFAGIARPGRFFDELDAHGVTVRGQRAFPDHHSFTPADLAAITASARERGAEILITTEKDAVRLQSATAELPLMVWSYRLAARAPRELFAWLEQHAGLRTWSDAA